MLAETASPSGGLPFFFIIFLIGRPLHGDAVTQRYIKLLAIKIYMDSLYVMPPRSSETDYHRWLGDVVGDLAKPVKKTQQKALVLIGQSLGFLKFLPVVLSREVLKRVELSQYSIDSLQSASKEAALVVVWDCAVGQLARDAVLIAACCSEAILVLCCPESTGSLKPSVGEAFGSSQCQPDGLRQGDLAQVIGLRRWFYVCDSRDAKQPITVSASVSTMHDQLRALTEAIETRVRHSSRVISAI